MSAAPADAPMHWFKSTRSAGNGNCVEVAALPSTVAVRDSKDPNGPVLSFETGSWRLFIADVRTGTFDGSSAK
jgi:Domain of unknown function (DUF397).